MPTVSIDATGLEYRYFIIPGVTKDWTPATSVQTLDIPPGTYNYQIMSGAYCDFTFTVAADGKVGYAPEYAAFLAGAGTTTLTLKGFPVSVDARYMPGLGIIWSGDIPKVEWMLLRSTRMLPCRGYRVQQGSGVVCAFSFDLDGQGRWQFNSSLDIAKGGFLRGAGTATLEFFGYPLIVDARRAGGAGVLVQPVAWGIAFAYNGVTTINLLPAMGFRLQFDSGVVSDDGFDLSTAGVFTLHDAGAPNLSLDTWNGLKRLTVAPHRLRFPLPKITLPPGRPIA